MNSEQDNNIDAFFAKKSKKGTKAQPSKGKAQQPKVIPFLIHII